MYVQSTEACSLPNSETPLTQQQIDDQFAFGQSVGTAFEDGDAALNSLIQELGGNPAGDTVSGAQGVPTTGSLDTDIAGIPVVPSSPNTTPQALTPDINNPSSWAWAPSPANPVILAGGGAGYRAPQGEQRRGNRRRYTNVSTQGTDWIGANQNPPANCPVIVPLVTAIPVPSLAPAPVTAPSPAPSAPAAPAPIQNCLTGNWCLDIMNGCVLSSQVSPEQLQLCSAAGYVGNKNLFPAVAAAGGANGGAYFGTPDPNPAPYSPGMSGLGQNQTLLNEAQAANAGVFDNVLESIITAAATAVALTILWKQKGKR